MTSAEFDDAVSSLIRRYERCRAALQVIADHDFGDTNGFQMVRIARDALERDDKDDK